VTEAAAKVMSFLKDKETEEVLHDHRFGHHHDQHRHRRLDHPLRPAVLDPPIAPCYEPFVKLNTHLGDLPALGGNAVELLQLNLEVTLMCYDPQVVVNLRQIEADYLCRSKPVNLDQWETRPLGEKFFENISRPTAALQ
jgi:hypothetical protein